MTNFCHTVFVFSWKSIFPALIELRKCHTCSRLFSFGGGCNDADDPEIRKNASKQRRTTFLIENSEKSPPPWGFALGGAQFALGGAPHPIWVGRTFMSVIKISTAKWSDIAACDHRLNQQSWKYL